MTIIASHNGLTYEEVRVPSEMVSMLFPRNIFAVRLSSDHAEITISTDLAGIPAVKEKLDALAAFMAISMEQPPLIARYGLETAQDATEDAQPQSKDTPS